MAMTLSESDALRKILLHLDEAERMVDEGGRDATLRRIASARVLVRTLLNQVSRGYHQNPGLVIYGNPPGRKLLRVEEPMGRGSFARREWEIAGVISREVHAITYVHDTDGKPYKHDFENPTTLLAIRRGSKKDVLITSEDGFPIWQEFED